MPQHADPIKMQHRLFAELSAMFGREVPLYDKALAVNAACNRALCDLLARRHPGLDIDDRQLDKTSGERHGAIRIGRPDEYRLIARFFACFGMHPHNFYDMTAIGAKSQPVIATAFRSTYRPEHRVFTSLLVTDYFDEQTRTRIEALLAKRKVFSDEAIALLDKHDRDGGLSETDAEALIREATGRIFKWTGRATGHALYKELCGAGFKIAADIACFQAHHLNHLTPNTLCMDLYTAAMKFCMGDSDRNTFLKRAGRALRGLMTMAGPDWLQLHFKHLTRSEIERFGDTPPSDAELDEAATTLADRLSQPDLDLSKLPHAGFKDFTEGPAADTPVLLRQDAYKALTEPVTFTEDDATEINTEHTARFGEIEQRFYATTPAGRALYDQCLAAFEEIRAAQPDPSKRDEDAFLNKQIEAFAPFPKTLDALLERGLVYAIYEPTEKGLAQAGAIDTTDMQELVRRGFARREGQRYEDFLPVSAAGIFASNLNQYGTASTAKNRPEYTAAQLESIMARPIIEADRIYAATDARSRLETYEKLGLLEKVPAGERERLEKTAGAAKAVR